MATVDNDLKNESKVNPFSFIDPLTLKKMIDQYYVDQLKIKDIMSTHNVSGNPNQFVKHLPEIVSEHHCPYCSVPMYKRYRARENSIFSAVFTDPKCNKCSHVMIDPNKTYAFHKNQCSCAGCINHRIEVKKIQNEFKLRLIENAFPSVEGKKSKVTSLDAISVKTAFGVLAFSKLDRKSNAIGPLSGLEHKIAPSNSALEHSIINALFHHGLISPVTNDISHFNIHDGKVSLYIHDVMWHMSDDFYDIAHQIMNMLADPQKIPTHWKSEYQSLWKEITTSETHELIDAVGENNRLNDLTRVKVMAIAEKLNAELTFGQILFLVWRAGKAVESFKQSGLSKGRPHATNLFLKSLREYDLSFPDITKIMEFEGYKQCPQSIISRLFFKHLNAQEYVFNYRYHDLFDENNVRYEHRIPDPSIISAPIRTST